MSVLGTDPVAVIVGDELEPPLPPTSDELPFVTFMESLSVDGVDLTR